MSCTSGYTAPQNYEHLNLMLMFISTLGSNLASLRTQWIKKKIYIIPYLTFIAQIICKTEKRILRTTKYQISIRRIGWQCLLLPVNSLLYSSNSCPQLVEQFRSFHLHLLNHSNRPYCPGSHCSSSITITISEDESNITLKFVNLAGVHHQLNT